MLHYLIYKATVWLCLTMIQSSVNLTQKLQAQTTAVFRIKLFEVFQVSNIIPPEDHSALK